MWWYARRKHRLVSPLAQPAPARHPSSHLGLFTSHFSGHCSLSFSTGPRCHNSQPASVSILPSTQNHSRQTHTALAQISNRHLSDTHRPELISLPHFILLLLSRPNQGNTHSPFRAGPVQTGSFCFLISSQPTSLSPVVQRSTLSFPADCHNLFTSTFDPSNLLPILQPGSPLKIAN